MTDFCRASQWSYWRDKKGHVEALEEYYPNTLAKNPMLQQAVYAIKSAEIMMDVVMGQLADKENEENGYE